jgi:hypothetical protein
MNPVFGGAFSEASEAAKVYRKRAKNAARARWNGGPEADASSISSSSPEADAKEKRKEENRGEETPARWARGAPSSISSERVTGAPLRPNANGLIRLPSGWFASEDGLSIERNYQVFERRSGSGLAASGRYIGQGKDGADLYVTGASPQTTSYDEKIREAERQVLRGHPAFDTLFPETRPDA